MALCSKYRNIYLNWRILIMHEIYDCDKHVYVPTIYEPVRKTDRVFVLRDGVIYEWDNTVTEQIAEDDLRHFNETNFVLTENKVSVDDILAEIAKGVNYQSNDTNQDKTESFLFVRLITSEKFSKAKFDILDDSQFGLADLERFSVILSKFASREDVHRDEAFTKVFEGKTPADIQAGLWLSRKEKDTNRLLTAWFAVSKLCEQLKAAKESKQATKPAVPSVTPAPAAEADKS